MPLFLSRDYPLRPTFITPKFCQLDLKLNPLPSESPESPVVLKLLHDFRDIRRPDILRVTFAPMAVAQLVVGAST